MTEMQDQETSRYREAGVDIDKGNAFIDRIRGIVAATHKGGVMSGIGGFSGLYSLSGEQLKDPVLVSSTDGVGTKLAIARICDRHDSIGIDLVAMCANDIVVNGAKPLFFLDYFASGQLDLDVATQVVRGIARGCELALCALIGGETAEMPGMYKAGDYDLAGFVVGIVERERIIDGSRIEAGDQIIGLASSGIHSNGYSLVRHICFDRLGMDVADQVPALGCTLGEELLRPTRIYVATVTELARQGRLKGLVHITGGGFFDNIPRVLPAGTRAILRQGSWRIPPVFGFLAQGGDVSEGEMHRTFNMGIGMVAVVGREDLDDTLLRLRSMGEEAFHIGEVVPLPDKNAAPVLVSGG